MPPTFFALSPFRTAAALYLAAAALLLSTPPIRVSSSASASPAVAVFRDLGGRTHRITSRDGKPSVFLVVSTSCPIANRYSPRIQRLHAAFAKRGVHFFAVYPNADEIPSAVRQHARERLYHFPVVRDNGTLTRRLGATITPEAIVLDRAGKVRYRGRIDDNNIAERVKARYVENALNALLKGQPVKLARSRAVGCVIHAEPAASALSRTATTTAYAKDIAPLLRDHCVRCHREGEVGPMPLETYPQAKAWARQITLVTQQRTMPPWKAASRGEFHDENRLTDTEIKTLATWKEEGCPPGDLSQVRPPLPRAVSGWKLGTPDAVFSMPTPYELPAEGKDRYRCFIIPTNLTDDRWISGIEFQPGNRSVVHHVSVFLDTSGAARKLAARDATGQPGYTNPTPGNGPGFSPVAGQLGGWSPGYESRMLPPGVGIVIPRGADAVLEVHYHLTGKAEKDRSRFAVYFSRQPVIKRLRIGDISNGTFRIPAGEKDYAVEASGFVPGDITVYSVNPHMHNIGKSMTVTAQMPDGTAKPLIHVPAWDFRWQPAYRFKEPVKMPRGTRIDLLARFDNSNENPHNPHNPPKPMKWGESTDDEMCSVFLGYTLDEEDLREETVVVPTGKTEP